MRRTYFWPVLQLVSLLVFLSVAAYVVREVSTDRAQREAADQVEKSQRVQECLVRMSQRGTTLRFLRVQRVILSNQIEGLEELMHDQPDSEALQRRLSAAQHALIDILSFQARYLADVPTLKECRKLADELGVPRPDDVEGGAG